MVSRAHRSHEKPAARSSPLRTRLAPSGPSVSTRFMLAAMDSSSSCIDKEGGVARDLGNRRIVGRDDGRATRHGFEQRQPESLLKRREDEQRRGIEERNQFVGGDPFQEPHLLRQAQRIDQARQLKRKRRVCPHDHQPGPRSQLSRQPGIGPHERRHVLSRIGRADGQDERALHGRAPGARPRLHPHLQVAGTVPRAPRR